MSGNAVLSVFIITLASLLAVLIVCLVVNVTNRRDANGAERASYHAGRRAEFAEHMLQATQERAVQTEAQLVQMRIEQETRPEQE